MRNEAGILDAMLRGSAVYADIFAERRTYTHIQVESEKVEKLEKGLDQGVGLRVIVPWKMFFASTTSQDEAHLLDLARDLGRISGEKAAGQLREEPFLKGHYAFSIALDPKDVETEKKVAMVRKIEVAARKMEKRIKQVRVMYRDIRQTVRITPSEGSPVVDDRTQLIMTLLVIGEAKNQMQTAYEAIGGFYGFDFFSAERLEAFVSATVRRLAGLLDAIEAPMGMKTVVLASEAGGTMVHEAIGHGLEADLAMEGLSCYKGMLGSQMASPLINIVDDKTIPHMRGTYAYDDEGIPSERTLLVENGILKNYLFDRFHALKYGMKPTANGRRESFGFKPIPRMSNTMILPGTTDPDKIIASVDHGVLVKRMGGGQVDTVRGDFVFEIQEGYLIEKGQIGPMIKNATMMGNGPKVLRDIDMIGTDLGFGIGTCGKDGQGVPVADAQPTLRIPEIIVGGRQQ
ncbi:MAG TPA: TldD/PmbA family protein [Syntrophorhabdales bacterium]|nr:TldD/PmbA family protein [Syntrophorhabdales bacterium]